MDVIRYEPKIKITTIKGQKGTISHGAGQPLLLQFPFPPRALDSGYIESSPGNHPHQVGRQHRTLIRQYRTTTERNYLPSAAYLAYQSSNTLALPPPRSLPSSLAHPDIVSLEDWIY
jgi:hypothetical protein